MNQITITIRDNQLDHICRVVDRRDQSVGYLHTLELAALLMASNVEASDLGTSKWIDLIASNGLAIYQKVSGEVGIVAIYPERERLLSFTISSHNDDDDKSTQRIFPVIIPPTIWFMRWNSTGTLDETRLFVIDPVPRSLEERCSMMYQFPFGNVESSGKLCWGTAVTPYKVPVGNHRVVDEMFFTSSFNFDLAPRLMLRASKTLLYNQYADGNPSADLHPTPFPMSVLTWLLDSVDVRHVEGPFRLPPPNMWGVSVYHNMGVLNAVETYLTR